MKMALVCDDLTQFGGQEQIVLDLIKEFPDADFFTSLVSKEWMKLLKDKGVNPKTSFMQKLPLSVKLNKLYGVLLTHVIAFESFDFSSYDIVLSVSSRFAHHVITKPNTKHICYMNTPGRMFWESSKYFDNKVVRFLISPLLTIFRNIDFIAAQRVDHFIANAKTPQQRIKKYYGRDSIIIYPYAKSLSKTYKNNSSGSYYLVISRLVPWKRNDIVIKACEQLKLPLKIIGNGPDMKRLKTLGGKYTTFLGRVSDDEKNKCISECIAVIHPQNEDFGIVPLEAMQLGKPVIAYGSGGALETITEETGKSFYNQTSNSLVNVLQNFNAKIYKQKDCINRVEEFSRERFMQEIKQQIGLSV